LVRIIGHLDLDYFYAQVEEVEDPSLKKIPVVVCAFSGRTEDSGVVSTANYVARELGVRSAIPIAVARRKLERREAKFVPMNRAKYEAYSDQVMGILRDNVDVVEQTGIDEAFFDITKKTEGSYDQASLMAARIKRLILKRERLTCSIGIAPNKVVAKLASDFNKPDGLTVVRPDHVLQFMENMPIEKLYGIGPKSAKILNDIKVITIGDLSRKDLNLLTNVFNRRFSVYLHNAANGLDEEPVVANTEAKQISRIITLKRDSRSLDDITKQLTSAIEDVEKKVLEKDVFFRSVSVIGILTDLSIRTKSKTTDTPNNDLPSLRKAARELLASLLDEGTDLRRVGIKVSDFSEAKEQTSLAEFIG
jgi:DNA polymerase IV (archaeal DinB-like DNA polymerase)